MGQQPLTFMRQVLALVSYPKLLDHKSFPEDTKHRAREILKGCRGESVGSYADSMGIEIIRKHAAKYIKERDGGVPSDWQNIVLTAGAIDGIKTLLTMLNCDMRGKKPGVMIPIPQYPLYSAILAEFDMHQIGYFLNEQKKWGLDLSELQRSFDEAKKGSHPRVIVVINPGNPTGQVLSRDNIEEIIRFSYQNNLFIFADEVYQDNVYAEESKFYSFKKVMIEMGEPYNKMELASFMSCSKGYMGECGLRSGYVEVINLCPKVKAIFVKAINAMLCPSVLGQAALDIVVNPPQSGEPSYDLFIKERMAVLESLKTRAKMVTHAFNSFEGFSCNPVQGAMCAFPQIKLSQKTIQAAKAANQQPDVFYAFQLLENTGICVLPGSSLGQNPGTCHFYTTILPQPEKLKSMLEKFKIFHESFVKKYA
ncbi:uncharacterized protein CBL_13839 [Carabus blaptoides fortunei]